MNYENEQGEKQVALYAYLQRTPFPGMLPAHAGFFSHFPSLGCPSVSLCEDTSEVRAACPREQLCQMPRIELMAAGLVHVRLLTVVRVSVSGDRCLTVLYQVCRVVGLNRRKLTVVERCRSNHLVNSSVDAFRLIRERKNICGEQPKIRILQH